MAKPIRVRDSKIDIKKEAMALCEMMLSDLEKAKRRSSSRQVHPRQLVLSPRWVTHPGREGRQDRAQRQLGAKDGAHDLHARNLARQSRERRRSTHKRELYYISKGLVRSNKML